MVKKDKLKEKLIAGLEDIKHGRIKEWNPMNKNEKRWKELNEKGPLSNCQECKRYGILYSNHRCKDCLSLRDKKVINDHESLKKMQEGFKPVVMKPIDLVNPTGESAIIENGEHIKKARLKEKGMEKFMTMLQGMESDTLDMDPIIITKEKGEIMIVPLEKKLGKYVLPDIDAPDDKLLKKKKRLVAKIVGDIQPTLKKQITNVTEIALMRKDIGLLKRLYLKLKGNKKPRLTNRLGCIFLEFDDGDEPIQI